MNRAEFTSFPVIVVEGGRVLSASRRARRAGVENGMQASRAQILLPNATVRQRDTALEEAAWESVIEQLNALTPFIESRRSGLAFVRGCDDEAIAALARQLDASIGVGPRRAIAHLAAVRSTPGHVLRIRRNGVKRFFHRFETKRLDLMDFKPEFIEHLEWLGISTLYDALHLTRQQLSLQFGKEGERLHGLLHPDGAERPVGLYQPHPVVRAAHDIEPGEEAALEAVIAHLATEATTMLGGCFPNYSSRRLALELDFRSGRTMTARRILNTPVRLEKSVCEAAQRLFESMLEADENDIRTLSTVRLTLSSLTPPTASQARLFGRRPAVHRVMRSILQKYPGVLKRIETDPHALWEEEKGKIVRYEL